LSGAADEKGGPVPPLTDDDLYVRGCATLIASWVAYARGAQGAEVQRSPGVTAAVFANAPESGVYNNALLERNLGARGRADAIDAMEASYVVSGVERFAAWVHETDVAMRRDLDRRGYILDTSSRAMGMSLDGLLPRPELELGTPDWAEYVTTFGLPAGLLRNADHDAFHLLVARLGGTDAATVLAMDFRGDCGIYNVVTLDNLRRRGLGTAVTVLALHDAVERGCRTASLQSTENAERLYARVGFRDLGRILEFVR
jgi:ribosomal protein S18 acetylase RimI-like enzyme